MDRVLRKRFILYGNVQGVGLRYRAYHAASSLGLTGFAKNNPDDSVTIELQGTEEEIEAFFSFVENSPYISINDMKVETLEVNTNESSFRTR